MSSALAKRESNLPALFTLADRAEEYAENSKAKNTRRAYASDLRDFATFCDAQGECALPASPQITALYLTDLASRASTATIGRRMVAIAQAHKLAGLPNPIADPHVREISKGIRRTKGTAQHKKAALTGDRLPEVLAQIDASTLKGKRDTALLLLTFALAGRRSEVAALNYEDIAASGQGLTVTIRKSKTDQAGAGREIGVPFTASKLCSVEALGEWLNASGIKEGALFRTFDGGGNLTANRIDPVDVARLVKRVTAAAGLKGDFSGHSLRSGFITTAANTKDVSEVDIQNVSGHRSVQILRGYVRRANVFTNSPLAAMFGGAA
jgi:integrase